MQAIDLAIVELRRCVQDLGMCGVQIGSHICGKSLDEPEFEAFWQVSFVKSDVICDFPDKLIMCCVNPMVI